MLFRSVEYCDSGIKQCTWSIAYGRRHGRYHITQPDVFLAQPHVGHRLRLSGERAVLLKSMTDIPMEAYNQLGIWISRRLNKSALVEVRLLPPIVTPMS